MIVCVAVGALEVNTQQQTWASLEAAHRELTAGGRWRPADCASRQRVAVVVPFRDRLDHLLVFLRHIHPILQRQRLEYQIFVVEQVMNAFASSLSI